MSNIILPKRPRSHVLGDLAFKDFESSLPSHWVVRPTYEDYGIDCEIEIVDENNSVTGALLKCQIKGTERNIKSISVKRSSIQYWLQIPIPVILVLVNYPEKVIKWINIRDELSENGLLNKVTQSSQKTISLSFKNAKILETSHNELQELAINHSLNVSAWLEEEDATMIADFTGYHILIHVFDGDPDKMIKFLREKGSEEQLNDIPFVLWVKSQIVEDPDVINKIRIMVEESSSPGGYMFEQGKKVGIIKP